MKNTDVEALTDSKIVRTVRKEISDSPTTQWTIILMIGVAFAILAAFIIFVAFMAHLGEITNQAMDGGDALSKTANDIENAVFDPHGLTAIIGGVLFLLTFTIWRKLDFKSANTEYLYYLGKFFPTIDAQQHEFINSMKKFHFSLKQPERELPLGYRWINTANGHKSLQEGAKPSNSLYGSHHVFETLVSDGYRIYLKRDYIKPIGEQWDSVFGMIENEVKQEIAAKEALKASSPKTTKALSVEPLGTSHQKKRSFFRLIR